MIALVVTVLVILILTAIILSLFTGENGILINAQKSAVATDKSETIERAKLEITALKSDRDDGQITDDEAGEIIASFDKEGRISTDDDGAKYILTSKNNKVLASSIWDGTITAKISTSKSYVGCYYDITPGDGIIDGVIYVDLADITSEEGETLTWGALNDSTVVRNKNYGEKFKTYYEVGSYNGNSVISEADDTDEGTERFYIMALTDISGENYCWLHDGEYGSIWDGMTSKEFGEGYNNTAKILSIDTFESTDMCGYGYPILWGQVQTQFENGWYVPSYGEWVAYGAKMKITSSNCRLFFPNSRIIWTSSIANERGAYYVYFMNQAVLIFYRTGGTLYSHLCVRLGATV